MERYILSIDQSTQGTKAMLFDVACQLTARADRAHRQYVNEKGWVSHDLDEILSNTLAVARDVLAKADVWPEQIVAVGISNQRETVAAWNRTTGEPVGKAIVWQCARAKDICEKLTAHADTVQQKTGIPLSPYFSAPKMAWILQNEPGAAELAEKNGITFMSGSGLVIWFSLILYNRKF